MPASDRFVVLQLGQKVEICCRVAIGRKGIDAGSQPLHQLSIQRLYKGKEEIAVDSGSCSPFAALSVRGVV